MYVKTNLRIINPASDTIARFELTDSIYDQVNDIPIFAREKELYKLRFHAYEARKRCGKTAT